MIVALPGLFSYLFFFNIPSCFGDVDFSLDPEKSVSKTFFFFVFFFNNITTYTNTTFL